LNNQFLINPALTPTSKTQANVLIRFSKTVTYYFTRLRRGVTTLLIKETTPPQYFTNLPQKKPLQNGKAFFIKLKNQNLRSFRIPHTI
jgi:hypothetical protein